MLRSVHLLKHEADDLGLDGQDIAQFVKQQQTLDRKERDVEEASRSRCSEITSRHPDGSSENTSRGEKEGR